MPLLRPRHRSDLSRAAIQQEALNVVRISMFTAVFLGRHDAEVAQNGVSPPPIARSSRRLR